MLIASIIIPAYNVEKYITDCLNSVLSIESTNYEVIVVDDGSTDKTAMIVDEYANRYKSLHVIHQSNQGVSAARNRGIRSATGEYLIFVDGDDTVDGKILQNILTFLELHRGMHMFIAPWYEGNETSGYLVKSYATVKHENVSLDQVNTLIVNQKINEPWKRIIRRELLCSNDVFFDTDMYIGEDICFLVSAMRFVCSCMYIDKPYYYYRKNDSSVCANVKLTYIGQSVKVHRAIDEYLFQIKAAESLKKKNEELLLRITSRNIQALVNGGTEKRSITRALHESGAYDLIKNARIGDMINRIRRWLIILRFYKILTLVLGFSR